jgi:hypothetical protein
VSSKTTLTRTRARALLHQGRAESMRAVLDRVAEGKLKKATIVELAEAAVAQDEQRMAPERIREALRTAQQAHQEGKA